MALLVCATAGVAAAKPSIAILGLEVIDKSGVPNNDDVTFAKTLTEDLRGRAKIGGPYSLANGADKELIDLKLLKGCDDEKDLKCMASIGGDLQADFLMYGSITKKSGNYEITITLLDVKAKKREKTAPQSISIGAKPDELLRKSQKIYNGLTGQTDSCTITVKTPGVDRATILIGSKESGNITNGIGQVNGLSEGKYSVAVEAKDYHRWTKSDIQCTGGETTNITADLTKLDNKIIPPPEKVTPPGGEDGNHEITGSISHPKHGNTMRTTGYVLTAVGVAAVVGGGIVWGVGHSKESDYKDNAPGGVVLDSGATAAWEQDHCNDTDEKMLKPNTDANTKFKGACSGYKLKWAGGIMAGGGAALAVLGIVMVKFSGNSEESAQVAGRRKHHEPFAITPVVSQNQAGALFRLEW